MPGLLAIALAAFLWLVLGTAAVAAPSLNGTFPTSGKPGQIALGPDGNVWFTLLDSGDNKEFGRIEPDGTITEYDTPNNQLVIDLTSGPSVAGGPNDRVWMSQNGGVIEWDPDAASGTAHAIATVAQARGIAADGDGNLWVVDSADGLVKVAPDGTKIDDVPVAGSSGRGIALGGDGRMWWADFAGASIRATSTAGAYDTDNYATGGGPQEVGAGPADQLAFANPADAIGRISTDGEVQPTATTAADPFGVAYAADEAYWFALFAADELGRLTQDGGYTEPISFPAGSGPRYIAAGPGGTTLWATLETGMAIARISGVEPPDEGPAGGPPANGGPQEPEIALQIQRPRVNLRNRRLVFFLTKAAQMRIVIARGRPGRRIRGRCVRPTRANRKRRFCRRFVRVSVIRRQGRAGRNVVRLPRRLRPGRYRALIVARADGQVDRHFRAFVVRRSRSR